MDKRITILMIVIIIALSVVPALAAEGHGKSEAAGHSEEHGFSWYLFLSKVVNSTVLFGGLYLLLRKPISKLLAQKSEDVKKDIIQREELLQTTNVQLEEIKKRLEKIELEVEEMKGYAQQTGREEQKRIEDLGTLEAKRIAALSEEEINNKVDASIRNLKERIAEMTIDHFKKDFQAHMDADAHDNIIEKNIEIIGDIIERK